MQRGTKDIGKPNKVNVSEVDGKTHFAYGEY